MGTGRHDEISCEHFAAFLNISVYTLVWECMQLAVD